MTEDKILELLSAYLDGESEDPEAVERLLEGEPAVRRRFEVLKAQSASLRDLKLPEVGPAFATRVLAGVRENGSSGTGMDALVLPRPPWRLWCGAGGLSGNRDAPQTPPCIRERHAKWRTMDPECWTQRCSSDLPRPQPRDWTHTMPDY